MGPNTHHSDKVEDSRDMVRDGADARSREAGMQVPEVRKPVEALLDQLLPQVVEDG